MCLANGSCDGERTFSQMRYALQLDRSRIKTDMLCMQIMHVNQDKLSMLFTVINNPFQNKHQISKKQMTFERVKKLVIPTDKIH